MVVYLDMKKIFVLLFLVFFSYPLYAQVMYLECSNIDRVFQMKLTNYWKIDFDNENAQLKSMGFIADYLIRDTDNTSFIIIYREFIYSDEDLAYFKEIGMLEEVLTDPYWKEHSFEFSLINDLWQTQSEMRPDGIPEIIIQDCIDLSPSDFQSIEAEYM